MRADSRLLCTNEALGSRVVMSDCVGRKLRARMTVFRLVMTMYSMWSVSWLIGNVHSQSYDVVRCTDVQRCLMHIDQ